MTTSHFHSDPFTYTPENIWPAEVYLDRNKCLKVVKVEIESHTECNDKYISGYGYVFTHCGFNSNRGMPLGKSKRGFIELFHLSQK